LKTEARRFSPHLNSDFEIQMPGGKVLPVGWPKRGTRNCDS
jgi:hypothetical protein